jgi:acetylornithine deacetylase
LLKSALLQPKRVVIGEPTSLHPASAGKGYYLAEVVVSGREAHSALPKEGASAIYGAARVIVAIEECAARLAQEQHAFFTPGFTTVNVGTIHGGTAKNIVAGQCTFQVEWRPLPGQSEDAVLDTLTRAAEQLQQADPRFGCDIKVLRQQDGFETAATSELVQLIATLTGRSETSIPFGSEASLFANVADEVVVFGPGDMRTAHSARECVPIRELEQAVECLRTLMVSQSNL